MPPYMQATVASGCQGLTTGLSISRVDAPSSSVPVALSCACAEASLEVLPKHTENVLAATPELVQR